ncbi:MAG: 3-methyl-2-oxobutanoate hydroxymethyltransferase [Selenomonadales bacterium]|jgi:3-methyl-2-oxobutanoate hydroxymethyltransferase|nr:3-methyl-2-oxobutanoate hydroxymethyltransferase [Selenomonadales bacterium]
MRISIHELKKMKAAGQKIAALTAYDYPTAKLVDECGIPIILVGDSLGMVVLGLESTIPVTMEVMLHHVAAVARGAKRAIIVGDMPFGTYHLSSEDALRNAIRLVQQGGATAVKLEGGVTVAAQVERIVSSGIPVMGHIGLTPQYVHQLGGYKVQGKSADAAERLLADAKALESAGVFSVVLECMPSSLAAEISQSVAVPTIGIGAGPHCDGQIQVISDVLGLSDYIPKHAKQFVKLPDVIRGVVQAYADEVTRGVFGA